MEKAEETVMMEKVKAFFQKGNLGYKLIALVLAILLWMTVTKPFM